MRTKNDLLTIVIIFMGFCFFFPRMAYAYIDPGTGSYIVQMLIAGLMGALFTIKLYWGRIKLFFLSQTNEDTNDGTEE